MRIAMDGQALLGPQAGIARYTRGLDASPTGVGSSA